VWLRELNGRDDACLNIGASGQHVNGWVSVDLFRDADGRCLQMDAAAPWPFADGTARAINSEHFIEHVDRDAGRRYLREAFRVLRPGGVIRTSTPDLRGLCQLYLAADPEALATHHAHGYEAATHADLLNNYVYLPGHSYIYDEERLRSVLTDCGFVDIELAEFGASRHEVLRGIDRHDMGRLRSIVVCLDAVRP
jgi:predicted SAM-dependent methyltransferase